MATATNIPTVTFPNGVSVPALGQGTWCLGEDSRRRADEIKALRLGIDLGMTLIDTAEMYGDGRTEEFVAEAIAGRRNELLLVSKVLPHHATARGTVSACEASLRRLRTDHLDLYLLHWRGPAPLRETLSGFEALQNAGKIRAWGVSNFDRDDMTELAAVAGGTNVATNQVLYNLSRRGIEWDLLPYCQQKRIPMMAYTPIEQGRILNNAALKKVASRHNVTPAQAALAWVLRQQGVIVIPRTGNPTHMSENRDAVGIQLSNEDLAELDGAFPPPAKKKALEVL